MKYLVCLTCFFLACAGVVQGAITPSDLTCEYRVNPLGINATHPGFSWQVTGREHNIIQSAFEIMVTHMIGGKPEIAWKSGKIISNQSIQVFYGGKPLQSLSRYSWRVRIYDSNNQPSAWSPVSTFEMAMLTDAEWTARWIGDGSVNPVKDEDYYKPDRMPLFRRSFKLRKKPVSARLYISGLGYYEAYLNSKKIGDHVLDPGFTSYRTQVPYVVYDISAQLKSGDNIAGVMLGSGWWNPLPFKFFGRWDLRNYQQTGRPCMKAEIHLSYADGSIDKIVSDEQWQTAAGPITRNNVYLGETYDARLSANWASSENWKGATTVTGPTGRLTVQEQPPVRVTKTLSPVSIVKRGTDTFIVDLGQNFAGVAKISVQGNAGTTVHLRYGEGLFPDGSLNVMTTVATQIKKGGIRGGPGAPETAWQQDDYVLKGGARETWSPRFTFHGFRYVEVVGWPGELTAKDIQGLRMNCDLPVSGEFSCSNNMFNQLHEAIQWTFLSNVFSVQSDCPGREKMGYGGDMVATSNSFIYNYDMNAFYRKAIQDFANDQRPQGGITEIAPFTGIADRGYGDDSGPLGWQLAFPFLQKQLYEYYGDVQPIKDNYAAFVKQLDFLASKAVEGLFYWDISDHEALDAKPEALTASCFYYHHLLLAATFAGILHKQEDSLKYNKQATQVKNAITRKYLVKGTGRFDNGTQSAQLFALWYDLSPERDSSIQQLMNEFARHDWHLSTGIFSTKMLFDVLRSEDKNEIAYRVANQRTFPGWGHMMEEKSTTLWETWAFPETGASRNHPMFGSIEEWFYRSLLGVNPAGPAFQQVIIKPQPAGDLTWAKGSYHSVRGWIATDWKRSENSFDLAVTIPGNCGAEIWIPAAKGQSITEGGRVVAEFRRVAGYAVVTVGSGSWHFLAQ